MNLFVAMKNSLGHYNTDKQLVDLITAGVQVNGVETADLEYEVKQSDKIKIGWQVFMVHEMTHSLDDIKYVECPKCNGKGKIPDV